MSVHLRYPVVEGFFSLGYAVYGRMRLSSSLLEVGKPLHLHWVYLEYLQLYATRLNASRPIASGQR